MLLDDQEVASFQAALHSTSREVLVKRLENNVIDCTWKRELAEQELARRQSVRAHRLATIENQANKRHHVATVQGRVFSTLLLVFLGFGAAAFMLK